MANLTVNPTEYHGNDHVRVDDGSTLPIHHVGSFTVSFNSGNLHLLNLFHIPSISKNLIYVRQFCEDNDVFFEFHSSFFCVKDIHTKKSLLQGTIKKGMYVFPPVSTFPEA